MYLSRIAHRVRITIYQPILLRHIIVAVIYYRLSFFMMKAYEATPSSA